MTLKTKTLSFLLLVAVVLAPIALRRPAEPEYKKRRLSDWFDQYQTSLFRQDPNQLQEAASAIRAIGTNALPYLITCIQYEPPHWRNKLLRNLPILVLRRAEMLTGRSPMTRAAIASHAITILGSNAVFAIPPLTTLMQDNSHPVAARRAMLTLIGLRAPALPVLLAAIENPAQSNRQVILKGLAYNMVPELGTNAYLPTFVKALRDTDPNVRAAASAAISQLATNSPITTDDIY